MHGDTSDSGTARILVVDNHPVVRSSIRGLLELHPDLEVGGEAAGSAQTWAALAEWTPDLIVMDLVLGDEDGLGLLIGIRRKYPGLPVLIFTMHSEFMFAERALSDGADGYIMKGNASEHLVVAIREVLAGRVYLSPTFQEHIKWKARSRADRERGRPKIFPAKRH